MKGIGGLQFHPSRHIIGGMLGRGDKDIVPATQGALSLQNQQASEQAEEDEDTSPNQDDDQPLSQQSSIVIQDIEFKQNGDLYSLRDPKYNATKLQNACKLRGLSTEGSRQELWDRLDKFLKKPVVKPVDKPDAKSKGKTKKENEKEAKELTKAKANEKKVSDNLDGNIEVIKIKIKREKSEMEANLMSTSELKDIENLKKTVENRLETAYKLLPNIVDKSNKLLGLIKKLEDIHAQKEENMKTSDNDDEDNDESNTKFVLDGYKPKLIELKSKAKNDIMFEKIDKINLQEVKDYLNEAKGITLIKGYEFPKYLNALESLLKMIDDINEIIKNNKKSKKEVEEEEKLKVIKSKSKQVEENAKSIQTVEEKRLFKEKKERELERQSKLIENFLVDSDESDRIRSEAQEELTKTGTLGKYEKIMSDYKTAKDEAIAKAKAEADAKAKAEERAKKREELEKKLLPEKLSRTIDAYMADLNFNTGGALRLIYDSDIKNIIKEYIANVSSYDKTITPTTEEIGKIIEKLNIELLYVADTDDDSKLNVIPSIETIIAWCTQNNQHFKGDGKAFEKYLTKTKRRIILQNLTGDHSDIYGTDEVGKTLIPSGPDDEILFPNEKTGIMEYTQVRNACVFDLLSKYFLFELKFRAKNDTKKDENGKLLNRYKAINYNDISHIGLTYSKIEGKNKSYKVYYQKDGKKWKVANILCTFIDKKKVRQSEYIFNGSEPMKELLAIFLLLDGIYYYDITKDMTDDPSKLGKKGILLKEVVGMANAGDPPFYEFGSTIYSQVGSDYQIPKNKFNKIS